MKLKTIAASAAILLASTTFAFADPIEGNWRTESGATAKIAPCGSSFCITMTSGDYSGRKIGQMTPSGSNKYKGEVTDPTEDKTYSGKAELMGNTLKLEGCVLMFCKAQNWTRK